nr:TPA_asm: m96.5 uoORF [Murid betaherpesvirus 1]DBA08042.1 TPA_asm: m96.5 uoORF [Murid betaherpesvirus 1]
MTERITVSHTSSLSDDVNTLRSSSATSLISASASANSSASR